MTVKPESLHAQTIVIDGLQCSDFDRALIEEALRGGVTAINCSAVLWENFHGGIDIVTTWKHLIRENTDIAMPVRTVGDIHTAKKAGKFYSHSV